MIVNNIIQGNCKDKLKDIPDKSVRCCVTSPPYFGLRDYGTGKWEGGDVNCKHIRGGDSNLPANICDFCGAIYVDEQIGLEETPEQYIANLVEVFEEVKRVLTDDGTLWVNIGDSYAGSGKGNNPDGTPHPSKLLAKQGTQKGTSEGLQIPNNAASIGLKPKDLIGIPWMLAFALRAAGWYLRQDIIWAKPSVMPESVTDRCTKSHEYIFLMSKCRRYFFDSEAIKEPIAASTAGDKRYINDDLTEKRPDRGFVGAPSKGSGMIKAKGNRKTFRGGGVYTKGQSFDNSSEAQNDSIGNKPSESDLRNKRSVWTISTRSFNEAHFATFPERLIEPCIKAGSAEGDIILDPFFGAGTTGLVAQKLNRNFIGIELNPKYIAIAERRLHKELGMFRKKNTEV